VVFHLIDGGVDVHVDDQSFTLTEADTCCAPGFTSVTLRNRAAGAPSFLFLADETPLHRKLGVFENRGHAA
jgi:gentisate 1,2-dioxygenase